MLPGTYYQLLLLSTTVTTTVWHPNEHGAALMKQEKDQVYDKGSTLNQW